MAGYGQIRGPCHNALFTNNNADVLDYYYDVTRGGARIGINLFLSDNGRHVSYCMQVWNTGNSW